MKFSLFFAMFLASQCIAAQNLAININKTNQSWFTMPKANLHNMDTLANIPVNHYRVKFTSVTTKFGKIETIFYCKFVRGLDKQDLKQRIYVKCLDVVEKDTVSNVKFSKVGPTEFNYFTKNK